MVSVFNKVICPNNNHLVIYSKQPHDLPSQNDPQRLIQKEDRFTVPVEVIETNS
jgi:hypothetical protein